MVYGNRSSLFGLTHLGDSRDFGHFQRNRLQQELQAHSVSLLAFQSVRPSNFQEGRNVDGPAQKSDFTAHDRAGRKKSIAEHADSAFGNVLCLTLKTLLGQLGRFQRWE